MTAFPLEIAARIKMFPSYLFAAIDKMKQAAIARGVDIINLGSAIPIYRLQLPLSRAWHKRPKIRSTISIPRTKACWRSARR